MSGFLPIRKYAFRKRAVRKSLFPAGLAFLIIALVAGCGNSGPEEVEIAVSLSNQELTPSTIRVSQDDMVTLKIESDAAGSLHLHGYDLEQDVTTDKVAEFMFVADATGRYRITLHPAELVGSEAAGGHGHGDSGGSDSPGSESPGGAMDHGMSGNASMSPDSGNGMSHDAMVSETPVSLEMTAEPDDQGGVNVQIMTEGWRWAPEEVNQANSPGAGHAHVYVDGAKINRVYGAHYYLMGLEPGEREIRVALNTNGHNEIVFDGQTVEDIATVTVEGHAGTHHDALGAIDAESAMSVEVMAHPDPDGGYNLQVMPAGFEFAPQNVDGDHVPGEGVGYVSIDGETHARLYAPWFKLPALEPGMHEITVTLANNRHQPYHWQGNPVENTATVHVEAKERSEAPDHHGGQEETELGSTPEGDAAAEAAETSGVEIDVGYLEVQPR